MLRPTGHAAGHVDWRAEFDPWGNQVDGSNPLRVYQPIRMQGQHYDEESKTATAITTRRWAGTSRRTRLGWWGSGYTYPLNPVSKVDPLGLAGLGLGSVGGGKYCQGIG